MENNIREIIGENIKIFRYRWVIIWIFAFSTSVNFAQFMQITIVGDILKKHYEVDYFLINMTGLVFMITFIIFFIPTSYMVEKTGLKSSMVFSVGLTAFGNCLKYFATAPNEFYLILISQTLISSAQIVMLITPSKIASAWFGPKEVSTACAIGLFGTQIGVALGAEIPTLLIEHTEDSTIIENNLKTMFGYNAVLSIISFVLVSLFFRTKPPIPPSRSQAELSLINEEKLTFLHAVKGFAKNRDFIIVLTSMGLGYGIWTTIGILVNQIYTNFFPGDTSGDLGLLSSAAIVLGGCFGTMIFGYILDSVNNYKWVAFFVQLANLLSSTGLAIALITRSKLATFIFVPFTGFFSGSLMVISYEYTVETTFPVPEAFGASILNVVVYLVTIFYVILLSYVFDTLGYLAGEIIIVLSTALGTLVFLLISPQLKRKRANLAVTDAS